MKDPVSACLRLSGKGKLKYDRFWVEEGRTQNILQINKELTKLHVSPRKLPSHVSQVVSSTSEDVPIVDKRDTAPKERRKEEDDLPTPASPVRMSLVEYEKERNKKVMENLEIRCAKLEHNSQLNHQWAEQQMQHMKQNWQLEMQKQINDILVERDKELHEVRERQQKQKEHNKTKARRLNDRKKEAEVKLRQLEEQQQQRKIEQLEMRKRFVGLQQEFHLAVNRVMECLQSQNQNKWLQVAPTDRGHKLKQIGDEMTNLLEKSGDCDLVHEVVHHAQSLLQDVMALLQEIQADIVQANAKKEHHETQELAKEQEKLLDAQKKDNMPAAGPMGEPQEVKQQTSGMSVLYQSISPSALQDYARVIEHHKKWEQSYTSLLSDVGMKKYRFELQKAVNTPVNAISAVSGMHLRDKVQRLFSLLSGQTVQVGDKRVSCTSHPQGLAFCMDLLAKKLVTQAENQVASNHEAAFPLAAVTVSLMNKFPDLTLLLLAHLYLKCPYLVPYYIPRKEGESQEEHYKSLGYVYVDGTIEKQDKFLKRMSGIVRFYGALIHTAPMPGLGNHHPHGLSFGWKFLARVLNLCPRVDVTATVLYHFLEVAGNALYDAYGKQFRKLLHILCKDYFQEIRKVTTGVSGGPLSRLQDFLENTIRLGKIPSPVGVLSQGFWNTR